MKKSLLGICLLATILTSCATLQSIVKSSFPYTANLIVPANTRLNSTFSATSSASSFDQIFTGQNTNTSKISQVRVSSAKITAVSPSGQSLGIFKFVKIYLENGASRTLVASRTNIDMSTATTLVLDIDNSKFLDDYLKDGNVNIRMEYALQKTLNFDFSLKASLGFNVAAPTP